MSLQKFVATPKFDEYQKQFKDHFKLERRADGVILAQLHTLASRCTTRPICASFAMSTRCRDPQTGQPELGGRRSGDADDRGRPA